jgi:Zn-dependent protease with chaperone function
LGEAADQQALAFFGGKTCRGSKGAQALEKLSRSLQAAAGLYLPARIDVISSKIPNAIALPGGKVYLFSGLLAKSESQDEIAGVLAHEMGHLQHRDHLRRLIANGGVAYLFGLLFGDLTGGGALVFAGRSLFNAAHSREAERAADTFAAQTMKNLGRPAKPMGSLLLRVTGPEKDGRFTILHDHPLSEDRLERLSRLDKGATGAALLSDVEWEALRAICE